MEESGDLRASSICEEIQHTLRRAVFHFQDLNRSPVQKVLLCIKIRLYWGWTRQLDQQNIFFLSDLAGTGYKLCGIYVCIKNWNSHAEFFTCFSNKLVYLLGIESISRANEFLPTPEIFKMYWTLKVQYCVHKIPALSLFLSQRHEYVLNSLTIYFLVNYHSVTGHGLQFNSQV